MNSRIVIGQNRAAVFVAHSMRHFCRRDQSLAEDNKQQRRNPCHFAIPLLCLLITAALEAHTSSILRGNSIML